ncbi:MAG: hypothetical protein K5669_03880 [Lachnospiraceae bacterium]|nr:hypothetical protein [Lachnospiraceae bacterium]
MGNKYDWKKIIQMVAVIGLLCFFVGIFTRIMQKSQTSLSDYAKKNPEVAYATLEKSDSSEVAFSKDDAKNIDSQNLDSQNKDAQNKDTQNESTKDTDASKDELPQKDYADSFYYTDEEEGYKFHMMYYNSKKEICVAEIKATPEDPDNALSLAYDLFKAEHVFENVSELQKFFDGL